MKDDRPPQTLDTTPLLEGWRQFEAVAHDYLTPIATEDQNERALELLEQLWKAVPDGETTHPLFTLLELLTGRIVAFEASAYPIPSSTPEQMLAYFMEQRGLTQAQVAGAMGIHQGSLGEILNGERSLTVDQIRALSSFFEVDPAVFL